MGYLLRMLIHPHIDPVALDLGFLQVHWYGLTYLAAFGLFYLLARSRMAGPALASQKWQSHEVEDMLFVGVLGVVLGGRLGYVLFYKPEYYLHNPLEILAIANGGMSFHGGLIGVILAMFYYAWKTKRHFFDVADLVAPCVPTGLAAGRIGNFINGELWGRLADPQLPWAMVFPAAGPEPRHPSQLYQFGMEGIALFLLLWWYGRKPRPLGAVSGLFLLGYGVFRFLAEYFREPDSYLGLLTFHMSMGQWLCVPMIMGGIALLALAYRGFWRSQQAAG